MEMCCLKKGSMEIAKELIFFFFPFFLTENGRGSPDIGKRHFNKAVARKFSIPQRNPSGRWHANARYFTNTRSLFSTIQIYILH